MLQNSAKMVRLGEVHFRKMRKMVDYSRYIGIGRSKLDMNKYVYTPPVPNQLKNKVSGKGDSVQGNLCLQEISVMLACWKANDFLEAPCLKEMQAFEKCVITAEQDLKRKQLVKEGSVIEKGRLASKQVNTLLRKYPQPSR